MATIQLSHINLIDRWPGAVNPNQSIPTDGWDGTGHSCVTTPVYPVGTKIMAYTDNSYCPGYYTMMYGGFAAFSSAADISGDFSDSVQWCGHCCLTSDTADATYEIPNYESVDVSGLPMTVLCREYTAGTITIGDVSKGGPVALPCATLEGYDYGWFWVGGVCPCKDVTLMQGTADSEAGADMTTDGTVVPGAVWLCITAGTQLLTGDISGFTAISTPLGFYPPIGYSDMID